MAQDFICLLDFCQESFLYFNSFISHFKSHIKCSFKIACPYENCKRQYSIVSSFSSHLYRVHSYDGKCERLVLHPVHNMRAAANAEQSSINSDITVRPTMSTSSITNFTSTLHCDIPVAKKNFTVVLQIYYVTSCVPTIFCSRFSLDPLYSHANWYDGTGQLG